MSKQHKFMNSASLFFYIIFVTNNMFRMRFNGIAVLCFILTSICKAQPNVRFEEVHALNNLSQNTVISIHQDKLGFLWLGTSNGLNKYDGYRFKSYMINEEDVRSGINRINSIKEDLNGRLWIETYDGKYHRFNPETEKLSTFPLVDSIWQRSVITNIYFSHDSIVWLATDNKGIYAIKERNGNDDLHIINITKGKGTDDGLSSNIVNFIVSDKNGNVWIGGNNGVNLIQKGHVFKSDRKIIHYFSEHEKDQVYNFTSAGVTDSCLIFGTEKNGLLIYKSDNHIFERTLSNDLEINVITSDNKNVWVGTSNGNIYNYSNQGKLINQYTLNDQRSGKNIEKFNLDSSGSLWILTDNFGITRLNAKTGNLKFYELTPPNKQEKTDDERTIFFEDADHQIWLGVLNMGLAYYLPEKDYFYFFSNDPNDPSSLASDVVESIYQDREGTMWIGTSWFGKGLNKMLTIDPAFRYFQPVEQPTNKVQNMVRSLHEDSYGNIWVGTKNGKVYIYDKNYKIIHTITKNPSINYSGHNVYSVYQDSKEYIWLCTKGYGIFRSNMPLNSIYPYYSKLTFKNYRQDDTENSALNNNNVYDICEDTYGRYWVATYGGGLNLLTLRNNIPETKIFNSQNSELTSDKIRDLFIDSNDRLWIGTTYGLNYIDLTSSDTIEIFSNLNWGNDQNISYNDVLMITEDNENNIWVSTAGGGINKLTNIDNKTMKVSSFSSKEGLKNDITFSILNGNDGNIWVGTEQGLSRYSVKDKKFENIDEQNGLPVLQFSERTNLKNSRGELIFGTVDGFYVINPENIENKTLNYDVVLTNFQLFNNEVKPGKKNSPLKRSIAYTKEVTLKHNQSIFAIEFASLTFKSRSNNQYAYILEGFEKEWNRVGVENKATYTNIPPGQYTFKVKTLNVEKENNHGTSLKITIRPPVWLSPMAYFIYIVLLLLGLYITLKIIYRFARLKSNIRIERKVAESKLRFFTNISHELRTPLTLILGPVENLYEKNELNSETKNQLAIVHKNSKRLLRIVNQLLDFRKVQNEKMKLRIQQINLVELVKSVFESFQELARQKDIDFTFTHDHEEIYIQGDLQQLDMVMFNLLSNAFKFTPQDRSVTIDITDHNENEVIIKVSDTGIGIPEDKLPFIFDRFFVSHTGMVDKLQGTGIGLSLVNEYIKLHKGEIEVKSQADKGTVFILKLKKGNGHLTEYDVVENSPNISHQNEKSLKIEEVIESDYLAETSNDTDNPLVLLVEDDPDMSDYIISILRSKFKTELAHNGNEGLEKAKKIIPDIIVSDIMMPEMDGYEFLRQLKNDFNTSHIPVIMLTAKTDIEYQVEGFELGAEAYISKPFNINILISNIQTLIQQRQLLLKKFDNVVDLKPDQIKVVSKDKQFIESLLEYINKSMEDPDFNVEKLVDKMNMSRTLFYKKVTSLTGIKPVELIREIRLKKAYQILETGEYNISEAAIMVGFNDIRYFSTCFKKQFGINPSKVMVNKDQLP